jgi:hypothetical protein
MSAVSELATGLQAALLLARGRADGVRLVETDLRGAARSFWAMAVCMPTVVCLRLMGWAGMGLPANLGRILASDLMVFGVSWLLFSVLTWHLTRVLGREERWPQFIVIWNWCNVIENVLLVFGGVPGLLGAPHTVDQVSQLVATGWALWLEWYAVRLALGVGSWPAVWLVLLDQSIGLLLTGVSMSLAGM